MIEFGKIAGLLVFSALRFFMAPAATVFVGYGFFETVLITFVGGAVGFSIFLKFGVLIKNSINRMLNKKGKAKPKFNFRNRTIVRVKKKYGLIGLALLTPCLFGVPLGAFLASIYFGKQKKTIPFFLISLLLWSVILTAVSVQLKEI